MQQNSLGISSSNLTSQNPIEAGTKWWWSIFTTDMTTVYYGIIVALMIIVTIIAPLTFYFWCIKAATTMHHKMFNNIIYSPMRFFNTNASGRILNRFARDIGILDESLPVTVLDAIQVRSIYLYMKISSVENRYFMDT